MQNQDETARKTGKNIRAKNVVITGANSGVGFINAKVLYEEGHNVIFGSRNAKKNQQAIEKITQQPGGTIKCFGLDLSVRKSVEQFVRYVKDNFNHIDILVNNAGLMLGPQKQNNEDGVEMTLAINHFGHFYLTYLLWQHLVKSDEARIINVSSTAHYSAGENYLQDIKCEAKEYAFFKQYTISKLFNVLFTVGLKNLIQSNDQYKKKMKTASLHPGVVNSGFYDNLQNSTCYGKLFRKCCCCMLIENEEGARTQLFLCNTNFENIRNGQYYNDDTRWKEMDKRGRNMQSVEKLWAMSEQLYSIKFR